MIIFKNNIKRIFKDKMNIILMIIMPIIVVLLSLIVSFDSRFNLGIVDNDKTYLSKFIIQSLSNKGNIKYIDEKKIEENIVLEKIDYAIVIDKGITDKIINGEMPKIRNYKLKDDKNTIFFENYVNGLFSDLYNMGRISNGNEDDYLKMFNVYTKKYYNIKYDFLDGGYFYKIMISLGIFVFMMLMLGTNTSKLILEDKRCNIYYRMFASSLNQKSYMMQNILSAYLVIFFQTTVIFLILNKLYKFNFNDVFINLYILFLIFSLLSVSLGISISNISKDIMQFGYLSNLIIVPMCMLGGCYWPIDFMPDTLQKIANFVPTSWLMKATEKIIYGAKLSEVYIEIFIIILFTIIFFLIGINKKVDISK